MYTKIGEHSFVYTKLCDVQTLRSMVLGVFDWLPKLVIGCSQY